MFEQDEWSSEQFKWSYKPLKPNHQRPVIIHRAILGSVERFMALLIEHSGGKWPLWISPRQLLVCSLYQKSNAYTQQIFEQLKSLGYSVELDNSDASINKKVRNGQLSQFNFVLVAGEEESSSETIDVRARDGSRMGKLSVPELHELLQTKINNFE